MNIEQISKKLLIYDENGDPVDMAGEWKMEPCKGQLINPDKEKQRRLKKLNRKRRLKNG